MTTKTDISDWPLLTRFYGITPKELSRTPRGIMKVYREQLPELVAQETLQMMQVADFPHMEQSSRREIHESLVKGTGFDPTPVFDPRTPGMLSGMGIAVVDTSQK